MKKQINNNVILFLVSKLVCR